MIKSFKQDNNSKQNISSDIFFDIIQEWIKLWIISPLTLIKPQFRKNYLTLLDEKPNFASIDFEILDSLEQDIKIPRHQDDKFWNIWENIKNKKEKWFCELCEKNICKDEINRISTTKKICEKQKINNNRTNLLVRIQTIWNLTPEDLISGKAKAKVYEILSKRWFLLRSLSYDKFEMTLNFQFFDSKSIENAKIMEIVSKLEFGRTELEIKNSKNIYPYMENYQIIDEDLQTGAIYTIRLQYRLPEWLNTTLISKEKINWLNSYIRLPLYEHRLRPHEDILDLYIELNPRNFQNMNFSDFPPADGIRVPFGFDLKYRKTVYMNFSNQSVQAWDYGFSPHYIIAWSTASGKSNFIKFFILQIIRSNTPNDVRFFLVDPKIVTFNIFRTMPHLYAPIVSVATKFKTVLDGIIQEVERRYKILAENNVENIIQLKKKNLTDIKSIPNIIVIVDEFADIVDSQDSRNIKEQITLSLKRLGQKARAAGVHLILITQRATSANIDWEIKANMSGRIAFKVATEWDSQLIIEDPQASQIVNPGEWFAKIWDSGELIHFQAPFVSDEDIKWEIIRHWKSILG